jgi:hypothetical protein
MYDEHYIIIIIIIIIIIFTGMYKLLEFVTDMCQDTNATLI